MSSEPLIPLTSLNSDTVGNIAGVLGSLDPYGNTPLVGATILGYQYLLNEIRDPSFNGENFVVLLTDGTETCRPDLVDELLNVDTPSALELLGIRTFVIGVPGSEDAREFLSNLAVAGGTLSSPNCYYGPTPSDGNCQFDMTTSSNFSNDLLSALTRINSEVLSCSFSIPETTGGASVDLSKVNVSLNNESIPFIANETCAEGTNGWQYTPGNVSIRLCGSACDAAQQPGSVVFHHYGLSNKHLVTARCTFPLPTVVQRGTLAGHQTIHVLTAATLSIVSITACQPPHRPSTPADQEGSTGAFPPVAPVLGLKRCVNLGNALDAPNEGDWGVTLQESHFKLAKSAGFDHVRLPVRFSTHADSKPPYTIDETFFKRVDWALAQAVSQGLSVILDMHHYEELENDPDPEIDRFIALWRQIATRYANQPETVIFELLNEPNKNLNPVKLNALYKKTIPVVRASNPRRIIMVDSYFWANTNYLRALELPDDPNVVVQFHMYQPILFTHQGAPWMGPEYGTTGIVFPGPPAKPVQPVADAEHISWVRDWLKSIGADLIKPAGRSDRAVRELSDSAAGDRPDGPVVNLSYWIFEALPALARLAPEANWSGLADSGKDCPRCAFRARSLPANWISASIRRAEAGARFRTIIRLRRHSDSLYLVRAGMVERPLLEPFQIVGRRGRGAGRHQPF